MLVSNFNVSAVFNQILDDLNVAIEARGSQRGRIGARSTVYFGPMVYKQLNTLQATNSGGAPQRGRIIDLFAIKLYFAYLKTTIYLLYYNSEKWSKQSTHLFYVRITLCNQIF